MATAGAIGKSYEYRLRDWFRERGWFAERNPLSGASKQITEEMGKHDVRAWKSEIFLQIECKKTNKESESLAIQQEWLGKINFDNDEILCFSFKNCKQHFCLFPKRIGDAIFKEAQINKSDTVYKPIGNSGFGFKREWLENKDRYCFQADFSNVHYYIVDLELYIEHREKFDGHNEKSKGFVENVKALHDADKLRKLYRENESKLTTREKRIFYGKLERIENGKFNSVDATVMKESQFWIDNKPVVKEEAINKIIEKVEQWVDVNLLEDEETGNIFWAHKVDVGILKKIIKKILGIK
jgi:hypothetical protein